MNKEQPGNVEITIFKNQESHGYKGKMTADNTDVLVEALAIMLQMAADKIGTTIDCLYAKVATLLFVAEETRTKEIPTSPAAPRNDSRGHTPQRKRKNHKKRKGGKRNGNAD